MADEQPVRQKMPWQLAASYDTIATYTGRAANMIDPKGAGAPLKGLDKSHPELIKRIAACLKELKLISAEATDGLVKARTGR